MILIVLSGMFALGIALFGTPLLIKLLSWPRRVENEVATLI